MLTDSNKKQKKKTKFNEEKLKKRRYTFSFFVGVISQSSLILVQV